MTTTSMLCNKEAKDDSVLGVKAWQWIHMIDNEELSLSGFTKIKKRILESWLTLLNLHLPKQ
jgi:hypothetical protein